MPADIEVVDGVAKMAYVAGDDVPWHGLANAVDPQFARDIPKFLAAAGMDTDHELIQLMTEPKDFPEFQKELLKLSQENDLNVVKTKLAELALRAQCEIQKVERFGVRRVQDNKIVGNVGPRYTVLQNRDAFNYFAPWLEAGEAELNTAGVLGEGAKVWILAKLTKPAMEIVEGDTVDKFLLLSHSHDGSLAVRSGFTPIRVVCRNTLSMAHKSDASKLIRVKHSKNVKINLEHIRETMNLANQEFEATAEQYRLLAKKSINQEDLKKYVKLVFALQQPQLADATDDQIAWGKEEGHDKEVVSTRMKHVLEEVLDLAETGKGNDLPKVRGTYWAAYNGVTQYLSYNAGNNEDSRMNALWFGQGANLNEHALKTALALAA